MILWFCIFHSRSVLKIWISGTCCPYQWMGLQSIGSLSVFCKKSMGNNLLGCKYKLQEAVACTHCITHLRVDLKCGSWKRCWKHFIISSNAHQPEEKISALQLNAQHSPCLSAGIGGWKTCLLLKEHWKCGRPLWSMWILWGRRKWRIRGHRPLTVFVKRKWILFCWPNSTFSWPYHECSSHFWLNIRQMCQWCRFFGRIWRLWCG